MNVQDDYFDTDIRCVLQKREYSVGGCFARYSIVAKAQVRFWVKPQIYRMEGFQCFELLALFRKMNI